MDQNITLISYENNPITWDSKNDIGMFYYEIAVLIFDETLPVNDPAGNFFRCSRKTIKAINQLGISSMNFFPALLE